MKKLLFAAMAAALLCATPLAAKAADQDIAKITCKEFLADQAALPVMIMWIDGYLSGKSDNTVLSEEWMKKLTTNLVTFCSKNPTKTMMDAIDALPDN